MADRPLKGETDDYDDDYFAPDFEDPFEEPDDHRVPSPVLAADDNVADGAGNQAPAPAPAPAPAMAQIQGNSINTVEKYGGKEGQEALNFIAQVDRARNIFNWTQAQTADIAKTRLTDKAQTWLRAEETLGNVPAVWSDPNDPNANTLKKKIKDRFGFTYSVAAAIDAVSDLQMKESDTVSSFYDRVRLSMDVKNFQVAEADRDANYQEAMARDVKTFFLAGLRGEYRAKVMGVPNLPDEMEAILRLLKEAEAEKESKKVSVMQVQEEKKETAAAPEPKAEASAPREEVNAVPQKSSNPHAHLTCYDCGEKGHIGRNCPKRNGKGRGRGGWRGNRQQQRGGGYTARGFRAPNRPGMFFPVNRGGGAPRPAQVYQVAEPAYTEAGPDNNGYYPAPDYQGPQAQGPGPSANDGGGQWYFYQPNQGNA